MLNDSEFAHRILYLELLRAKTTKKYCMFVMCIKLLNLRNVGDRVTS